MTSGGGFGGSFLHGKPVPPPRSAPVDVWEAARSAARGASIDVRPPSPDQQIVQRAWEHARRCEFIMTVTREEQRHLDECAPVMLSTSVRKVGIIGAPVTAIRTPHGTVLLTLGSLA